MTPTHKPEDGDRAPISNGGAELETAWKCGNEFAPYHRSASHVQPDYRDGWNHCYTDATAVLAEKAQRIERLEAALRRLMRSFPTDFDMTEAGWEACEIEEACKAHDLALAALSQPHPHGG